MKKVWLVLIMACLLAGMANAQSTGLETDVLPPDWRGDPNTTLQAWSFDESDNPASLDWLGNPYGTPVATITTTENPAVGPLKTYWLSDHEGRDGVWRIFGGDYMELYIPNTDLENPFKEIWLQMTWSSVAIDHAPLFQTSPGYFAIELIQSTEITDSTYYRSVYKLVLEPNPAEELIWILPRDCEMYIDEIIVDTKCVPEPSSLALIGAGGLVGLFIRRRFPSAQRGNKANDYLIAPRTHMRG